VDPVTQTPTEPVDYAALNAVWGTLAAGVLLATREDAPPRGELPVLALATFALTKALAKEKVGTWVREPLLDEETRTPKGSRLRYAAGELLSCTRCLGTWSSLGPGRPARRPSARGPHPHDRARQRGINDWLQSGFTLLTSRTNVVERVADLPEERFTRTVG
jgi:hypothetical protein